MEKVNSLSKIDQLTALKNLAEQSEQPQYTYPFRSQRNSKSMPRNYEVNTEPSKTIPDQTMPISEILKRYASGLPLEGSKVPIYNGDEYVPDLRKMDLSEIEQMRKDNATYIAEQQEQLQKAAEEQRQKEHEEKIIKRHEEKTKKTDSKSASLSDGASGEAEA